MRRNTSDQGSIRHLTLHREFFLAIAEGVKKTEWRQRTPYWEKRLEGRRYDVIKFRNGYLKAAPEMIVEFKGVRRYGRRGSGSYGISLGRILSINRWPSTGD